MSRRRPNPLPPTLPAGTLVRIARRQATALTTLELRSYIGSGGRRWWCYEGAWSSGGGVLRALPRWIDWASVERQRRRGEASRFKAREWARVEREARAALGGD